MKKSLLVGSTFRDAREDQLRWLELQLSYLSATTPRDSYDYCCVVNERARVATDGSDGSHGNLDAFASSVDVIDDGSSFDTSNDPSPTSGIHIRSLNRLLYHFKGLRHEYEYFLFLDGDAFPIRNHWFSHLVSVLLDWERLAAAVLRCEALERRWHASVLLVHTSALDLLRFGLNDVEGGNLAALPELDVGIGSMQTKLASKVFPLIRTNRYNLHPISYGIYYDMFYHNGFGGDRHLIQGKDVKHPWYSLRGESAKGYCSHYIDKDYPWKQYNKDLMDDPQAFIGKLAGWSPTHYADLRLERRNWY